MAYADPAKKKDWHARNRPRIAEYMKTWYAEHPGYWRRGYYRRKYGITEQQYGRMLEQQLGVCKLCGLAPRTKSLSVDHDHKTGRVRGLLCWFCNHKLLGSRGDNPEIHRRAVKYLTSTYDGRRI